MEIERIKQKIITEECMAAIPKRSIRSKNKKYIFKIFAFLESTLIGCLKTIPTKDGTRQ